MIYIVAALLITLLGVAYVKGFDLVKRHSPDRLPQFCLLMAAIRFLLLATLFAISVFFSETREETTRFAIVYIIMYVLMMTVTLSLRH
ncbi:MAG: hypothetical protein IJ544_09645 [Prevotella sp.]|nr:hypothetical protein [Prevotella sp.]